MRPSLEELERRDVPSAFLPVPYQPFAPGPTPDEICVPWWGGYIVQERTPMPPAGMEPVLAQDYINQIPMIYVPLHPTYLQPTPPWFAGMPLVNRGTTDSQWQAVGDYSVDQPGGAAYVFIPRADWLNFQHAIYYPDPSQVPPIWQSELAGWQQTVQADDQALFAVQDAYWAAQTPNVVQPTPTVPDPLSLDPMTDNAVLLVQVLQHK